MICGGTGRDLIHGGRGHDRLHGGPGRDEVRGGGGSDDLRGGSAADVLIGGNGNDWLSGMAGADLVRGGPGKDDLQGDGGPDSVYGGDGNDRIDGGEGDDRLVGGPERDKLQGDSGHDRLFGNAGADRLSGARGRDFLHGGPGPDVCYQGNGTGPMRKCEFADIEVKDLACPDEIQLEVEFECTLVVANGGPHGATYELRAGLRPRAIRYDPDPPQASSRHPGAGTWLAAGTQRADSLFVVVRAPTWLPEQIVVRAIADKAVDRDGALSEAVDITIEDGP